VPSPQQSIDSGFGRDTVPSEVLADTDPTGWVGVDAFA